MRCIWIGMKTLRHITLLGARPSQTIQIIDSIYSQQVLVYQTSRFAAENYRTNIILPSQTRMAYLCIVVHSYQIHPSQKTTYHCSSQGLS
jgi:hypothetical protein